MTRHTPTAGPASEPVQGQNAPTPADLAALLDRAESYLSALHGSVARHDQLAANLGCAGCELRDQIRAQLAVVPPAVDRVALRDRIADAIKSVRIRPKLDPVTTSMVQAGAGFHLTDEEAGPVAVAVLDRLPAPAEFEFRGTAEIRAAVLREAADECDKAGAAYAARALNEHAAAAFELMGSFLRMANETDFVATPCDFVACKPGGEPCDTHERLWAHAEGEHELCAPECPAAVAQQPEAAEGAQR